MTGGRHQRWKLELQHPYFRYVPPPPLPHEAEADLVVAWWGGAARLRQSINQLLQRYGLTFSQWRMVHATEVLVRETGSMVSQLDIGRRAHMDASTASRLMFKLGDAGWLDWGPDYFDFAYRIVVTDKARRMLAETRPRVVEAARAVGGGPAPSAPP